MEKVSVPRMTLLFALAVVASYSVAHATEEIEANKGISRGGPSCPVDYANFKAHKFSHLNLTILGESLVEQSSVCALACLETAPCISFNLAAFPDTNEKLWCELLPSDKYNNSDKFVHSNYFHHFSIASPCSSWPCNSNSKCVSLYEQNSYLCVCKKGFTGKNCETDIDECSTKHDCDVKAECTNTEGSYNCTCAKEGYYGDGRNCAAGKSCSTIKKILGEQAASGVYCLIKNGSKFLVYCDMTSHRQDWTLIARFSNNDTSTWMKDSGEWWYDKNVASGRTTDPLSNTDMISPAFWLVSGNEIKITRSDDPQHTALLQTTGDCLGGQAFRSKIVSFGNFRNKVVWASDKCLGNCTVQYGGQYQTTEGFGRASCDGEIQSANQIGFWCDWSAGDGAVMMIGGGGIACGRADHGIGITEADNASFGFRNSLDFGNSPASTNKNYALNLWIR